MMYSTPQNKKATNGKYNATCCVEHFYRTIAEVTEHPLAPYDVISAPLRSELLNQKMQIKKRRGGIKVTK